MGSSLRGLVDEVMSCCVDEARKGGCFCFVFVSFLGVDDCVFFCHDE